MNRLDWLSILISLIHLTLAIFGVTIITGTEPYYVLDITILCIVNNVVSTIIYSSFLILKQSSFTFQTRICISFVFGIIPHGLIIVLLSTRTVSDDIINFLINSTILYGIQLVTVFCTIFNVQHEDHSVCLDCSECYEDCCDCLYCDKNHNDIPPHRK